MKNSKKLLMQALGASFLWYMSSNAFAQFESESTLAQGTASIAWSAEQADSFLSASENTAFEDDISPQGSVNITTNIRNATPIINKPLTTSTAQINTPQHSVTIVDTSKNYSNQPSVNARAALIMDAQTGEVLYSKNSNTALPIASITKLMTAVIVLDARLNMSERIVLQSVDFAGAGGKNSSSTLRVGDQMNRAEALLFALMKSENPAAAALARTYPGGRAAFVKAMNAKAKELGMNSAQFVESTGLDPRNRSSARDLGILASTASQYGLIRQFSTTPSYDFNLGYRVLKSNNTNALVRNGGWNINISKTGYINEAGRCVVMHTTLNNRPAVVVLLGASDSQARTNDAIKLMNWVTHLPKRI